MATTEPGIAPRAGGAHAGDPEPPGGEAPGAEANPALIGVPTFVIGSVALGLYLIGYQGTSNAVGGMLPVLLFANGMGLVIATIWAIRVGQGAVASVFAIFAGFWLSFPTLVFGLAHEWFGIPASDTAGATGAKAVFLLTWFVGIVMLTLASLRLPSIYTVLFLLVDAALIVVLIGTLAASTTLLLVGGILVFAFALVGVYLFMDAMYQATGGKAMPMGRPIISS